MSDSSTCPDCKAPMSEHEQGYCPHQIETGEQIAQSELTNKVYRVTKWVEADGDRMISLQKEEIDKSEMSQTDT